MRFVILLNIQLKLLVFAIVIGIASGCHRAKRGAKTSEPATSNDELPVAPPAPPPTQEISLDERVEFTFGPEIGCLMGDMDTISKELQHKRSQRLLFSIEPVLKNDPNFKPIVRSVDPGESVTRGTTVSFNLPKIKKPVHLGLFVCKDNENEGFCASKPVYNLVKMNSILFFNGPNRANKVIESDKIYYFQYMLYDGKNLRFMSETVKNAGSFNRWANALQKELASSGDRTYHKQALARVDQLQRMLTSKRIEVRKAHKKTELSALLPLLDTQKCIKGERAGEPYKPTLSGPTPGYAKPQNTSVLPKIPGDNEINEAR